MAQRHEFNALADYFQFYLPDESAGDDLSESWAPEAVDRLLARRFRDHRSWNRRNMAVPVFVEIADGPRRNDLGPWDQVNECCMELPSGRLVVAGCADYLPEAARIELPPATYRAPICYGNLSFLSPGGLVGDDHNRIVLWPAPTEPLEDL